MNNLDKNYLRLQFRLKVHEKNATEFQTFFENIMQEAYPDFQKIRPYGKEGDKGNDGYRPNEGIYYQVYAPKNPNEKDAEAARKLKRDFEKLKTAWDQISKVKIFYFVFNDKRKGSSIEIEKALAELRDSNPEIEFKLFLAKDLEDIFFKLNNDAIQLLGFDIDLRNTLHFCRDTLAKMELYLDRRNGTFVLEWLQNSRDIIASQKDESLLLESGIIQCRALQQLERIKEARDIYWDLHKRHPNDPRSILYLAEIYLDAEDYDKNEELLKEAEKIDKSHWLLEIEKLIRDLQLGNKIDATEIDEQRFPADPRVKSNFYRLYSLILAQEGDFARAETFIERAIYLNPDKLANYIAKLSILEYLIFSQSNHDKVADSAYEKLLLEIETIIDKIKHWGELSARSQVVFNLEKFKAFLILENLPELERLAKESFDLILQCYFDRMIDQFLTELLISVEMPELDFNRLLDYLRGAEKAISDQLAKVVLSQFLLKKTLFDKGRDFFREIKKEIILAFISNLEEKKYEKAWLFLENDLQYAIAIANSAKDFPDFRKKIIDNLPTNGNIQKEKLLLLLNYDESHIDEAYEILRKFDLSKVKYFESRMLLQIARQKKAWEFVILLLEKLLSHEQDKKTALQLELELFNANLKLKRLPEVIKIGERILSDSDKLARLENRNRETLLAQTILARVARGEYPDAMTLMEKYPDIPESFEFKLGIEADVYLGNQEAQKAIQSIVSGIKILKTPRPEQYAKLFFALNQIHNMIDFPLDSLQIFEAESFVKFRGQERWYFVGNGEELEAIKITMRDERYAKFSDKKVGDKVLFDFKYRASAEHIIEKILPIEKYIFVQSVQHFNQLAAEGNLEAVWMVEIPKKGNTIDTKNIEALMEDTRRGGEFFDKYCKENIPLAFLGAIEGNLISAIGLIQNENRGFINFSSGDPSEMERQKEVAKRIIAGHHFYIDGTSALFLSETGLLGELYPYLPNIKAPQSVIAMLLKCKERFRYIPGQAGHMHYFQGKLRFSASDPEQREKFQKNFANSVKLFESKPENIGIISAANKIDEIEQNIPAELCDACILAQKDQTAVLTEDYLYLQANAIVTGKKAPEYCSAFALIRVLYEEKKITFEKYLSFFAYLSSYRFRFLPVTVDDIEKAVFGDGIITIFQPEKIKWFNFSLTLSEAYGVPFALSLRVVATFLIKILTDNAILPDVAERIFLEILSDFPGDKEKRTLGKLLLAICAREIEKIHRTIIIGTKARNKIDRLSQLAEIYKASNSLWTPPN